MKRCLPAWAFQVNITFDFSCIGTDRVTSVVECSLCNREVVSSSLNRAMVAVIAHSPNARHLQVRIMSLSDMTLKTKVPGRVWQVLGR